MLSRWNKAAVTVLDEEAGRFLVLQQSLESAMEQLQQHGLSVTAARAVLNAKCSESAWRAAFVHCAAATAVAMEESLKSVPESSELDDLRKSQATLGEALSVIQEDIAADRLDQERRDLEAALNAQAEQMIAVSVASGIPRTNYLENRVWHALWASPLGQRLQELREAA